MSWLKSALQVNNLPHMLFKSNWTSFFSIFVQFWWYSMLVELHFTEWTVHGWKSLRNRSFLQAGRTQKSVKPAATGHEENISKYCINITDARIFDQHDHNWKLKGCFGKDPAKCIWQCCKVLSWVLFLHCLIWSSWCVNSQDSPE